MSKAPGPRMSKRPLSIRWMSGASKALVTNNPEVVIKGDRDACTDTGKGRRPERGGGSPDTGGYGRVPEVQPGTGQGRGCDRGWPPLPKRPGQARSVRRQEAHRHRRAIRGDQGARRWLL